MEAVGAGTAASSSSSSSGGLDEGLGRRQTAAGLQEVDAASTGKLTRHIERRPTTDVFGVGIQTVFNAVTQRFYLGIYC